MREAPRATRGLSATEKRDLEGRLHAAGLSWSASKTAVSIVSAVLHERASSASMPVDPRDADDRPCRTQVAAAATPRACTLAENIQFRKGP